jgi:hypothetical protein
VRLGLLVVLVACGSHVPPPPYVCPTKPAGDPARLTARPEIDPPQVCAEGTYLRVRGPGRLPFTADSPGHARGCTKRPDGAPCTSVDLGAIATAIRDVLRARGINASWGLGACYVRGPAIGLHPERDWDNQHFGFVIYDWDQADATVAVVADTLLAWDAAQALGVSVMPIHCSTQD